MNTDFLEWIAGVGGIGAVFGIIMFWVYRHDAQMHEKRLTEESQKHEERVRQDRIYMEDRLTKMIEADLDSRRKNTEVLTELTVYLRVKNGNGKGKDR